MSKRHFVNLCCKVTSKDMKQYFIYLNTRTHSIHLNYMLQFCVRRCSSIKNTTHYLNRRLLPKRNCIWWKITMHIIFATYGYCSQVHHWYKKLSISDTKSRVKQRWTPGYARCAIHYKYIHACKALSFRIRYVVVIFHEKDRHTNIYLII